MLDLFLILALHNVHIPVFVSLGKHKLSLQGFFFSFFVFQPVSLEFGFGQYLSSCIFNYPFKSFFFVRRCMQILLNCFNSGKALLYLLTLSVLYSCMQVHAQ